MATRTTAKAKAVLSRATKSVSGGKSKAASKRKTTRAKSSLLEAPATKRLRKADAETPTRATAARKTTATAAAPKKSTRAKTARRPGSPLITSSDANRRVRRSATGQRLGPGGVSGGV